MNNASINEVVGASLNSDVDW